MTSTGTPAFRHSHAVPAARRPPALHGQVFRKKDAVGAGLLTSSELRSSAWRRLYRGVYVDAKVPESFWLRIAGAALLTPASAVFSGRTAAYLHGATALAEDGTPVEITVPTGVRFGPVAGLRVRQAVLSEGDVDVLGQRRCTDPRRTALDIARVEPLLDAVVALDVLLARAIVGRSELKEAAAHLVGRGARRAQQAIALADPRSESPPESRLRVLLAMAGLPTVPQYNVRDRAGNVIARVDLAVPECRVAIEYDGAWHAEDRQFFKDRRRLNRLVAAGWTVLHVTAADMHDFEGLLARLRALLQDRNFGEHAPR
jgi:very-short-patch-repair endonuclease